MTGHRQKKEIEALRREVERLRAKEAHHRETEEALRRSVEEKKQIETQVIQARRMEAIGQLAGGVAHDFNNLLTIIKGYSQLLLAQTDETDARHEDLQEVVSAADRAAALTRQLLLFSRKQKPEPKNFSINALVDSLKNMLARLIGEDIELVTELSPEVGSVHADPGQIEQVIMNVVINARDAMPRGGTITLSTLIRSSEDAPPEHGSTCMPGRYACVRVADSGVGIPPDHIDHIFDPFFSTKRPGRGTGLGLSVVYGIVQEHHGCIDVKSKPGEGSVFNICLPLTDESAPNENAGKLEERERMGRGEAILLIEDEQGVRKIASRTLREHGYNVTEAGSREEAVAAFAPGRFALVFSDMVLPDATGLDIVRHLQTLQPDLKILLTSGYTDVKAHKEAVEDCGYLLLRKPYELNELLQRIGHLLNGAEKKAASTEP